MQTSRRSACRLLFVIAAASACTDQTPPTAVPAGMTPLAAAAGANNEKVKVKTMQLSANTLRINGASVSGIVAIGNSGAAIQTGVIVRAEITQPSGSRQAVNTPTRCTPSEADEGKLTTGTCEMSFTASASNSAPGAGTLNPGPATFTLHVVQTSDAGETELANKSLLVNLVGTVTMTVTVAPTTIMIGGAAATATAVIQNPANSLQGVFVQGYVVQGTAPNQARRPTGGSLVTCGSNPGVLPPGTCTMSISVGPSNGGVGVGTLVAGPVTFELNLMQSSGSGNTTLDVETAAITLTVPSPVTIFGVTIPPTIPLASDAVPYTAFISNTGASVSNVVVQTWISQGTARRAAGGRTIQCGTATPGVLPTTDSCAVPSEVSAMNDPASGNGILVPGPAILEIDVDQQSGATTNLAKTFVPVTLTISGAAIINIALSATDVVAGQELTYTVTFYNPTASTISGVGIQGLLSQGPIQDFGTGGFTVQCPGVPDGDLPPGACTMPLVTLNTRNIDGIPSWQLGAATWRLELSADGALLNTQTRTIYFIGLQ
jgi:hypothetical protein